MKITLRKATIDDLPVLQHWDRQEHVVESDPSDDWHWEAELQRDPSWRQQLIAELNGRPIGFVQIIDAALEETHYWGDVDRGLRAIDIWIGEEADLGKGYGTEMMKLVLEQCFAVKQVNAVLIDPLESNTRAHRFYERLGFRPMEKRTFGEDDCIVFRLERAQWRQAHRNN